MMTSNRRVIIVNHTYASTDGQGEVNRRIADALVTAGQKIVLIGNAAPAELREQAQVEWHPVALPEGLPTSLRHQLFARRTHELIKRHRRDGDFLVLNGAMTYAHADLNICHFVHGAWARSPGHDWRQRKTFRNGYQRMVTGFNSWWEQKAYRQAERVVAVSESVRGDLISFAGVDTSRIDVIPNGIDLSRIESYAVDFQNHDNKQFRLGFCGDLKTQRKNLDLILAALSKLKPNVTLLAAGNYQGGPYQARIAESGLSDRVQLLGPVDDISSFYRQCDAFICASHYEPWGLVVPEAMIAGLPVIVSQNVGAATLIQDGFNGCVISSSSALDELVNAVNRLQEDPGLRVTLGKAARITAQELQWQNVGRHYVDLISRMSSSRVHAN